nr:hypothetical protein BaRGS_020057 [Batillaria attramentaria]
MIVYERVPRSPGRSLLLQVCLGRPLFLFPCGFHSSACLVMLQGSFRRVEDLPETSVDEGLDLCGAGVDDRGVK